MISVQGDQSELFPRNYSEEAVNNTRALPSDGIRESYFAPQGPVPAVPEARAISVAGRVKASPKQQCPGPEPWVCNFSH